MPALDEFEKTMNAAETAACEELKVFCNEFFEGNEEICDILSKLFCAHLRWRGLFIVQRALNSDEYKAHQHVVDMISSEMVLPEPPPEPSDE